MARKKKTTEKRPKAAFIIAALLVAILIAFLVSPFASSHPDGLEWAAEKLGFIDLGELAVWEKSPMPDYTMFGDSTISGMLAGLLGTVIIFGIGWAMGAVLKKGKAKK
jgi:hypothetical protein